MKVTSNELNKMIRNLEDEKSSFQIEEQLNSTFRAAVGEDVEDLRPDYNFAEIEAKFIEIDNKIMSYKHALNMFNINTEICGLTIDQVLIKMPQITRRLRVLDAMRQQSKKKRASITGNVIDYSYTSYDPEEAEQEYQRLNTLLNKYQVELDKVNTTITFEI